MGKINRLIAIYNKVPRIQCQGLCVECCGPLQMQKLEYERLGKPVWRDSLTCPVLVDGRCSNYENRPLVCRLFGVDVAMPCPWGCVIEGGPIDGTGLLREMTAVSPEVFPTNEEVGELLYRAVCAEEDKAIVMANKLEETL